MTYNIELRQKIKEKELRIENIAPFGGSFIKCLIDPRPPMSLQVASNLQCHLAPNCSTRTRTPFTLTHG